MKKFLIKVSISLIALCIPFYWVLNRANGYSDEFYLRFTTPKQSSLILGTSRAAQGIIPTLLDSIVSRKDLYNYAFALNVSNYGPAYLESIEKKLAPETKNGLFILAVDPWALSSLKGSPNDTTLFAEKTHFIATTKLVNSKPNIEYLFKNYPDPFLFLIRGTKSYFYLHNNGWLEADVSMDSSKVKFRVAEKMKSYHSIAKEMSFSSKRMEYLIKTIEFLKVHGTVYIVRMPVHPQMMAIEKSFMPTFNNTIVSMAPSIECSIPGYDKHER